MPKLTSLMPETLAQISTLLNQVESLLPATEDLSASERQSRRKIGPENAFVITQMAGIIRQTPDFLPRDFDDASFLAGADEQERLVALEQYLVRLAERATDARIAQGDPVVKQASIAYNAAKKHRGLFLDENLKKIIERRRRAARPKPPPATSG